MARLFHKYVTWLLPMAVIVSMLASPIAAPVLANPGLQVSGAILLIDASPGETLTHKMTVSIDAEDSATDIAVEVGGMGQSLDGAFQILEAPADTSSYSARQFITVDKASFHLEPGTAQDLTVTVQIPQDISAGGRYAIISIMETSLTDKEGVTTLAGINVLVALTIKDTQLTHQGKITALTTEAADEQAFKIFTTFQNTGNHHFKVKGEVTVSNSQGEVLDTISMPLTSSSIIPNMSQRLQATFIPQGELPPGVYSVKSRVMLEDGTLLDEASGSFKLEEPYVPPPGTQLPGTQLPDTQLPPPGEETPAEMNWTLIGGSVAAVIIVGLIIVICLLIRRRRAY